MPPRILLFTSTKNYVKLASMVGSKTRGYSREYRNHITPDDYPLLDSMSGVVYVGPQTSIQREAVFENKRQYYDFLKALHRKGLQAAAVLEKSLKLPGENYGIDHVIQLVGGERSMKSIGIELADFFDGN